jgi:hypothetical protein
LEIEFGTVQVAAWQRGAHEAAVKAREILNNKRIEFSPTHKI